MKAKSTFLVVLAAVICFTTVVSDAAVRKGPYLIYEGVNTEMTVLWQLDNTQTCTIEWGETLSYGNTDTTTEYGGDNQHAYTIAGLTPGVKYYYQVVGVGSGSFTAAPANDATDVKFLAYGDTRTNPDDHDAVCAEMITTYTSDPAYQTITLHVGDWVNSGDNENDWTNQFFDPAQTNSNAFQADMPINGCKGNHEQSGNLFYKYFPYPYVSAFYWSFDYGPVHVAVVDQYPWSSTQRDWLENDLYTSTKQWKILVFHEPGWSAGGGHGNRSDVQTDIQPLCLAYGADIVLAGHNHYYARCDVEGIQHITTGGGGAPLRTPEMDYPYVVTAESVLHFCEIDIQGNQLTFVARRESGSVIDTFAITRTDMQVTPSSKAIFTGTEGGPFTPASHGYTVSNTGDASIDWTVDYVETWLQCTPVSGTLGAGQQADVTVSLTSVADTLPFGAYFDTLTFTDTTNSETILRDVECRVGGSGDGLNGDYYDNMDQLQLGQRLARSFDGCGYLLRLLDRPGTTAVLRDLYL
jgi:predicted phosphodiesterase